MVSITLSVPVKTRKLMKQFPEMNWSGFIRAEIEEKTRMLQKKAELEQIWKKEQDFNDWAVKLIRKGRQRKLQFLEEKGLI